MVETKPIRIILTEEQRKQVREAIGRDAEFLELSGEEVERIAAVAMTQDQHLHDLWVVLGLGDE